MALDFSTDSVEAAPDFSKDAAPDFSQASTQPRPTDAELIAQRDAAARAAARSSMAADAFGSAEDIVGPLSHPLQSVWDSIDTVDRWLGLTPKTAPPPAPLQIPKETMPDLGVPAERAAYLMGYSDTSVPQIARGAGEFTSDFARQQLTPDNLLLIAGGGAGGYPGAVARTAFGAQMAAQIPDAATQAGEASVTGDVAEKTKAYLALGVPMGLVTLLAKPDFSKESTTPKPSPEPAAEPAAAPSEFGGDKPLPDFSAQAAPEVQTSAPVPPTPVAFAPDQPPPVETPDLPTRTDVAAVPVERIDANSIATRPDLMQFKRMDDRATGVNDADKLSGTWDDLKAGNLLLWQPNDPGAYGLEDGQKYIVANGHHRFEFGARQDVPAYNAQIIRESEGYSAQDARSLAAEINIADGKGTVYDATKFLRNTAATYGADAALARAGSIGIKGRQAATIAFEASSDNYDSFVNQQISPEQSEAIAKAAPLSGGAAAEPLQRVGIRSALDGASPQALGNLIQAVRLEAANVPADQLDLFGADDSAMRTAEQLSKVAGKLQNTLSAEIRSTEAAARNASTAKAKGISFEKPPEQILADNAALKAERGRWDNWALHPDLVSQVREYARMGRSQAGMPREASSAGESSWPPNKLANENALPAGGLHEDPSQYSSRPEPSSSSRTRSTSSPGKSTGPTVTLGLPVDPITGKRIYQKLNDVNELLAQARQGKPDLDDLTRRVADVDGAQPEPSRAKGEQRLQEKLNQRQPSQVSDYVGSRILVDTPRALAEVHDRLNATGAVQHIDDFMVAGRNGYRAVHYQIELPNGHSAEVQVIPRDIRDVMKAGSHKTYAQWRNMTGDIPPDQYAEFQRAFAEMKGKYDTAFDRWTKSGRDEQATLERQANQDNAPALQKQLDAMLARSTAANDALHQSRVGWMDSLRDNPDWNRIQRENEQQGTTAERLQQLGDIEAKQTAPSLIDRLQSMKMTGSGEVMSSLIPGVDPATFRAVWNTGIDIAIAAVRAGKAIGEAVQAAVDHIRSQFPQGDEETLRAAIQRTFDGENGETPGRQRVGTILAGDASTAVKAGVAPDLPYEVRSFDSLTREAKGIIAQHGVDGAFEIFKRPELLPDDTRTALGAELERTFRGEEQRATAQGDTAKAEAMAQRQVDLWNADAYGTRLAQGLNARRLYDDSSPQAKLKQAKDLFDEAAGRRWEGAKPAAEAIRKELDAGNADAADALRKDPQVNADARAAVNEHVADSADTHKAVVMELAEPWAQSSAVLQHAREAVRAKVNQLLNTAPRPPGLTPAQHLRAMMDDLASRAASIASGHYQGAEPTIPLRDKLQQRLGLSADAAGKLSKQLDAEFARQVEAAKKKIPQRIANQLARQAAGLAADPADAAVDRTIRQQLQAMNQKLGSLVTQHVTTVDAAGRTIADRIVADSGLTGAAADQLRDTINRRWEKLATDAKQSRLDQLARSPGGMPGKMKGMLPDLIKLSNLGAFDDAKYFDTVKKKLGLPEMTNDLAREIVSRANALEKLPVGDLRDRASTQLLNWIVQQRGTTWSDLPMGIYISNLLSGIKTPVKILFENGTLLASQTLSTLRNPDLIRHPIAFVAKPWAQGQLKGMLQSLEVMRSGIVTGVRNEGPRPSSALEQRPFGKYDDWLNIWKYPLRIVAAAHVPLFKPAMDLKATALAADLAKRKGLKGPELVQRVADIMGNTDNRVAAAKAQAQSELRSNGYFAPRQAGETLIDYGRRAAGEKLDYQRRVYEILDQRRAATLGQSANQVTRDYALHYTYLNEPYGFVGFIGEALRKAISSGQQDHPIYSAALKSQVPFTTVASNIINEHLNWTPLGLGRAALSHYTGELYGKPIADPSARGDLYARATAGTVLASGLAYAVAKGWMNINGPGPSTPQAQRQWRDAGNEPWSITVGDRRYSYANTPWASSLAVLGAWNDFRKFGRGDEADANTRLGFAMKAVSSQALNLPMLTGIHDLVEAVNPNGTEGDKGAKLEKLFVRTAAKFAAPSWLRDVDQAFDPAVYDTTGASALVASQVPFFRRDNQPVLNRLGEPVQRGVFSSWSGAATQDPVWRAIVDKGAWIPEPDRNHVVGDKKLGPDFYRTITPDELYDVVKDTGPRIRARLEASLDLPQSVGGKTYMPLRDLSPADAKQLVRTITEEEERAAYARLR